RETAVVRRDVLLAEPFPKVSCDSLRKPARVDEDKRGVVLANQLRQSIVNFIPNLAGHHSGHRRLRQLDGEVEFSGVTAVDDGAVRYVIGVEVFRSDEKTCDFFDGT